MKGMELNTTAWWSGSVGNGTVNSVAHQWVAAHPGEQYCSQARLQRTDQWWRGCSGLAWVDGQKQCRQSKASLVWAGQCNINTRRAMQEAVDGWAGQYFNEDPDHKSFYQWATISPNGKVSVQAKIPSLMSDCDGTSISDEHFTGVMMSYFGWALPYSGLSSIWHPHVSEWTCSHNSGNISAGGLA